MKPIEIANQPRLSFLRTLRITIDGVRYRLFRASVTVAVIAMAVAFLMNITSEGLLKRSVARDAPERLTRMRLVNDWLARLSKPGSPEQILSELAAMTPGGDRFREAEAMLAADSDDMKNLTAKAAYAQSVLTFFDGLEYARRRGLLYTAEGVGIFEYLSTDKGWNRFDAALDSMPGVRTRVPGHATLREFLAEDWPEVHSKLLQLQTARKEAIAGVTSARGDVSLLEALTDAEGPFGESIREAGFTFDPETTAPTVARQARRLVDVRWIEESLNADGTGRNKNKEPVRQFVARHRNVAPTAVTLDMFWDILGSSSGANDYIATLGDTKDGARGLTAERVVELSDMRRQEAALEKSQRLAAGVSSGWMGLGERMGWLLLVSMLVCVIGISNAMLMTVTERFREIATLKCLGALDGFIMIMFVLESCFLGLVGGVIGAILGALIGVGRMVVGFGATSFSAIPFADLLAAMLIAVGMGMVLAAVAAVYPALKAARLAPMEAMRIE